MEPGAKTVDFCDNPACWRVPSEDSESHRKHLPNHDVFKTRKVVHLRDIPSMNELAERALNVAREYFQASTSSSIKIDDAQGGDLVHDTLGRFCMKPSAQGLTSLVSLLLRRIGEAKNQVSNLRQYHAATLLVLCGLFCSR